MLDIQLSQLFGSGSFQDSSRLVLSKQSLGLSPGETHRAEQLLAALIFNAVLAFQGYITDENNNRIELERGKFLSYEYWELYSGIAIEYSRVATLTKNENKYRQDTFILYLFEEL